MSLIGKSVKFKSHLISTDCHYGNINIYDTFIIIKDNLGITKDGSGIRMVEFRDSKGTTNWSDILRFDIIN
uniref:Uncharacterized protein n=1 Tax=viral metagenome TaxID=1070528 RepID=A0A6C0J6T0_9ZZZZ